MLNLTSRLAIKLRYLPDWEFDWSDNSPQSSRDSLTLKDFLPDEEDAVAFTRQAVEYTMRFLVKEFPSLHTLKNTLPELQPLHAVMKTEAVPQKVLFKDEKYIHETIVILEQLIDDANLQGDPQVQTAESVYTYKRFRHIHRNKCIIPFKALLITLHLYVHTSLKVVIGDQMTCKNIRGGKLWRQSEIHSINKLSWVKEIPGTINIIMDIYCF